MLRILTNRTDLRQQFFFGDISIVTQGRFLHHLGITTLQNSMVTIYLSN